MFFPNLPYFQGNKAAVPNKVIAAAIIIAGHQPLATIFPKFLKSIINLEVYYQPR